MPRSTWWLLLTAGLFCPGMVAAQDAAKPALHVAAADSLRAAMPELQQEFLEWSRLELQVSYGSSGELAERITKGEPFDVFLSADMEQPRKLVSRHLAEENSLYRYAVGRVVLWSPKGEAPLRVSGVRSLLDASVIKIAVADARRSPYGQAAMTALTRLKLSSQLSGKLLLCESDSQALERTQAGEAQIALLPLSLVFFSEPKESYLQVPIESYPALDQGAVVLKKTNDRDAAAKLLQFLKRWTTTQTLKKYGFVEPPQLGP